VPTALCRPCRGWCSSRLQVHGLAPEATFCRPVRGCTAAPPEFPGTPGKSVLRSCKTALNGSLKSDLATNEGAARPGPILTVTASMTSTGVTAAGVAATAEPTTTDTAPASKRVAAKPAPESNATVEIRGVWVI